MDGDVARIPLRARDGTVRAYAIVDAADAEWVNQWRWCLYLPIGYAARKTEVGGHSETIYLHRALLGLKRGDGLEGYHRDRDRLNCRRSNLRVVRKAGNDQNRGSAPASTSAHRGVSWRTQSQKWHAQIKVHGKKVHLGYFANEIDAAVAARAARARWLAYAVD